MPWYLSMYYAPSPRMFSLNQIGQPGTLALFILPYLMACIFFAMTASIAIRNRETCMLISYSPLCLYYSSQVFPGRELPSSILEILLLHISINFRYQRICENQQHGSNTE